MNHAGLVRMSHGGEELTHQRRRPLDGDRPDLATDDMGQRTTFHVLHHDSQRLHAERFRRHDVRMTKLLVDARLATKTLHALRIARQHRVEHLDGHALGAALLRGLPDGSHPALADKLGDAKPEDLLSVQVHCHRLVLTNAIISEPGGSPESALWFDQSPYRPLY